MARFIGLLLASFLVAMANAQDPDFCRSRAVPYTCLTPLFTREILEKIAQLKDINLVAITRLEDNQIATKLDALDTFCGPFLASTKCGKAGNWYECSRDIAAVKSLVDAVQDAAIGDVKSEWRLPVDKIQTYMRYAALVCSETNGLRQVLREKECILEASQNASDHFRDVQLRRLSDVLASGSFAGKCAQAQNAVFDLMDVIEPACPSNTSDAVFRFISASFTIVPGFSADSCPINRTRSDFVVDDMDSQANETETATLAPEPEWCAPRTSAAKYRCFAKNLKNDLLSKVNAFTGLNPVTLLQQSEAEIASRLKIVNQFCDFLNETVSCADEWWQCKADVISVTKIVNDFQDLALGTDSSQYHIQPAFIERHFKFAGYPCATDDLERIYNNRACITNAISSVQEVADRIGALIRGGQHFNAAKQCESTKADVKTVAEAIQKSCEQTLAGFTSNLLSAAFVMVDGYSQATCDFLASL